MSDEPQITYGLYLSAGDEYLRVLKGNLSVERDGEAHSIPLQSVESVVASSRARISGAAVTALHEEGVSLTLVDGRGAFRGRLEPNPSPNALLRRAQLGAAEDPARALLIARAIVAAKLVNQKTLLLRRERRGELDLSTNIASIDTALASVPHTTSRAELMGHEGVAARAYFDAWPRLLEGSPFTWTGRSRRPPADPVNALLSYGYAIATARCADAASIAGLDPYIGFLHADQRGRPELGLDLVEEFRTPLVDSVVLALVNRKQLLPEHFHAGPDGACLLTPEAKRPFFAAFDTALRRELIHPASGRNYPFSAFPILQARLLGHFCAGRLTHYTAVSLSRTRDAGPPASSCSHGSLPCGSD